MVEGFRKIEMATIDQTVDVRRAEWGASEGSDLEGKA